MRIDVPVLPLDPDVLRQIYPTYEDLLDAYRSEEYENRTLKEHIKICPAELLKQRALIDQRLAELGVK